MIELIFLFRSGAPLYATLCLYDIRLFFSLFINKFLNSLRRHFTPLQWTMFVLFFGTIFVHVNPTLGVRCVSICPFLPWFGHPLTPLTSHLNNLQHLQSTHLHIYAVNIFPSFKLSDANKWWRQVRAGACTGGGAGAPPGAVREGPLSG